MNDKKIDGEIIEVEESNDVPRRNMIIAGPTRPLSNRRVRVLRPTKFKEEPLSLSCEWADCQFHTKLQHEFSAHVASHYPLMEIITNEDNQSTVYLSCQWKTCFWKTGKKMEDLQGHLYLHAYHTKLKCIGQNTINRSKFSPCRADTNNRNLLPDLSDNLVCAWDTCCERFTNIQTYYDHIRVHCEDNPRGRKVPGGIPCRWTGCTSSFANITKLRDHMRSHTQEKLLACPNCGGLFANRTRFFDHCSRQELIENESYTCETCLKSFATARLLRDHIRSHINTYRCSQCEMSCSSPSALQAHVKYRHSDEKPFPCETCEYAAKSQGDLIRHERIHKHPIYSCGEEGCTYTAKAPGSLVIHWDKEHSTLKKNRYVCHVCDKRFQRGYYLTKHLISKHKCQWPAGHSRFRYKLGADGFYRLQTVRYEVVNVKTLPMPAKKEIIVSVQPEPKIQNLNTQLTTVFTEGKLTILGGLPYIICNPSISPVESGSISILPH